MLEYNVDCYWSYLSGMRNATSWELITSICRDITSFQLQAAWRPSSIRVLWGGRGNTRERNYKLDFDDSALILFSPRHSTHSMPMQEPSLHTLAENVLLQHGKNRTDSFKRREIKRAKERNSAFSRPQNGRVSVTSQTLDRRRHSYIIRQGLCAAPAPTMEVRTTATPWLTIYFEIEIWNFRPCFKTILHLYLVF